VQFGKGTQIQFRREYLATNPLEDEDDDEYENDVPGEQPDWRDLVEQTNRDRGGNLLAPGRIAPHN